MLTNSDHNHDHKKMHAQFCKNQRSLFSMCALLWVGVGTSHQIFKLARPALSHCSAKRKRNYKTETANPGPSFLLKALSIESRIGEHDLEHKFAVSNVELEVEDRGMKIVVQIVVQILCKYVWSRLWFGVLGLRV